MKDEKEVKWNPFDFYSVSSTPAGDIQAARIFGRK